MGKELVNTLVSFFEERDRDLEGDTTRILLGNVSEKRLVRSFVALFEEGHEESVAREGVGLWLFV